MRSRLPPAASAAEERKNGGQQEAEQERGHEREVEGEAPLAVDDVAGQAAEAERAAAEHEQEAEPEEDRAQHDKDAADVRHAPIVGADQGSPRSGTGPPGMRRSAGISEARRRRSTIASLSGKAIFVIVIPQPEGRPEPAALSSPLTQTTRPTALTRQPSPNTSSKA